MGSSSSTRRLEDTNNGSEQAIPSDSLEIRKIRSWSQRGTIEQVVHATGSYFGIDQGARTFVVRALAAGRIARDCMRNNYTWLILISTLSRQLIGRFRLRFVGFSLPVQTLVIPSFHGLFVEFLFGLFGPVLDVRHGEILPEFAADLPLIVVNMAEQAIAVEGLRAVDGVPA